MHDSSVKKYMFLLKNYYCFLTYYESIKIHHSGNLVSIQLRKQNIFKIYFSVVSNASIYFWKKWNNSTFWKYDKFAVNKIKNFYFKKVN